MNTQEKKSGFVTLIGRPNVKIYVDEPSDWTKNCHYF